MNGAVIEGERAASLAQDGVDEDRWSFGRGVLLGVLLGAPAWVVVALGIDSLF